MKPTTTEWVKRATGQPPGWCDAGGPYLGYGATQKIGEIVPCEVCGKPVKLRDMLSLTPGMGPAYPRHKLPTQNNVKGTK